MERKNERILAEKATSLLFQYANVTVVSIDTGGYPHPIQMSKIHTQDLNEMWMITNSISIKVSDFRKNTKPDFVMTITVVECRCVVLLKSLPMIPYVKNVVGMIYPSFPWCSYCLELCASTFYRKRSYILD